MNRQPKMRFNQFGTGRGIIRFHSPHPKPRVLRRHLVLWSMATSCLYAAGCVERQLVIKTEPTDALVKVDGSEIGRSPATMKFTFYGLRRITVQKEGYEPLTAIEKVYPPWYQIIPLDLVGEVLYPGTIVDRREFTYTLQEAAPDDPRLLVERANEFRSELQP
jgi:hypothetical protein